MSHENGAPASVSLEAQLRARDSAALRDLARRAWPLGARGQWPVLFPQLLEHERLQELLAIPGVVAHGGAQVRCTADAAPVVARELGVPCPPLQLDELVESWESEAYLYPGRDEWHRLGLSDKLRPYQVEDAFFAARRSMVLNCNPARSGKIAETYATAVLRGVPRLLILCPDIAKWGWAEDAAKFLNQDAAILYGRSARIARGLCLTCNSGRPTDLAPGQVRGPDGQPVRCPRCLKFDGTSDGFWRVELRARACKGHAWKGEGVCPGCQDDFDSRLLRSRAVIANYDILTPHKVRDAAGKVHFPAHLAGVPARLRRVNFGSVVLDEGHELRGWTRAAKKINRNTRDYVRELIRGIPICEIVTATPMMSGYVRDLVSLLDLLSDGAMIDGPARRQFKWLERYCLDRDAPIWMEDFTFKPIAEVKVGDRVWGWEDATHRKGSKRKFVVTTVTAISRRRARLQTVTMASGRQLRCTPDHVWASGRKWARAKGGAYRWTEAFAPGEKREFDSAGRITRGHWRGAALARVIDVSEPKGVESADYALGYFHGATDGDGTVQDDWYLRGGDARRTPSRRLKVELVVLDKDFAERYAEMLRLLGFNVEAKPARKDTAWSVYLGREGVDLYYRPRDGNEDYWRGYLGGIYDAEGWGYVIAQYYAKNPGVYDCIVHALTLFQFQLRQGPRDVEFTGGREAFVRFWNLAKPACRVKRDSINENTGRRSVAGPISTWTEDEVATRVVDDFESDVWCLTTGTSNFVAYGYASHNCDATRGDYGLLDKGTSDLALTELPARLSMFTIRRDRSVIQPYLPRVMPRIVHVEKSADRPRAATSRNQRINVAQFDATASLRDDAAAGFEERELGALNAKAEKKYAKVVRETILDKVGPVCNDARLEMLEGRKVLIFTWAKSSLFLIRKQLLATMASDQYRHGFEAVNARVFCAHSDNSSGEERRNWGKQFTKHEGAAAFLTTHDSFQVGASLQGATLVCVAELHYNADAMNQSLSRPMEGNAESIAYNFYVVRDSPDETMVKKVLPKISTAASVTGDKTTSTFFAAFEDEKPKMPATLDEMINMLTAGIDFSHGDLNAWSDDDGGLDDSED